MTKIYSRCITVVLVLAAAGAWGCRSGDNRTNPLPTAEATVRMFCELDSAGKRLSSETWPAVRPYIAWQEEPGWDRVTIITGFRVGTAQRTSDTSSSVKVEYAVLGTADRDFHRAVASKSVVFQVVKTALGWKITSPDFLPPHVLAQSLLKHLERTGDTAAAAGLRQRLEQ